MKSSSIAYDQVSPQHHWDGLGSIAHWSNRRQRTKYHGSCLMSYFSEPHKVHRNAGTTAIRLEHRYFFALQILLGLQKDEVTNHNPNHYQQANHGIFYEGIGQQAHRRRATLGSCHNLLRTYCVIGFEIQIEPNERQ